MCNGKPFLKNNNDVVSEFVLTDEYLINDY